MSVKITSCPACHATFVFTCHKPSGVWRLQPGRHKCIYVAPNKSLVQERVSDWHARMDHLGLQIMECTGDSDSIEGLDFGKSDIIATTPCVFQPVHF